MKPIQRDGGSETQLWIVCVSWGAQFSLDERIEAVALNDLAGRLADLEPVDLGC